MKLSQGDIRTREVLDWSGIHLFHAVFSSCSQKVRSFLNLKGLSWSSHPIDLGRSENMQPYYLGINPRGLVPTLVIDGEVHIESNDIISVLEQRYPDPSLIPAGHEQQIAQLLRHEDELHLDLRTITFRFLMDPSRPPRSPEALQSYAASGSGTVGGRPDEQIGKEIEFWRSVAERGIPETQVRASVARFRAAFEQLDQDLIDRSFLFGDRLSVIDIAWLVYANRLILCGYPLARLHPRLGHWADDLARRPEFALELALPPPMADRFAARARALQETGMTLQAVCRL